jgi:hypothetical protein
MEKGRMTAIRVWILFCAFAAAASFAQETNPLPTTITVDGVTYSNVSWRTVTPATVSIFHQTGVASIPLKELPPDLQQRFNYDPQKAADYNSADAATQARLTAHIADVKEAQRIQQLEQALQQQYTANQSQSATLAPTASQTPSSSQIVPLNFTSVQFRPASNGLNRATLTLTSQDQAFVVYSAEAETFLNRCAAECAVWRKQEHNLARDQSWPGYSPYTGCQFMFYAHPTQTYTVYGAQIGFNTYKLLGNATYQKMGGPITYIWR